MAVQKRLMPDLEEEMLFRLSVEKELSAFVLAKAIWKNFSSAISLAIIHETLQRFETHGLISVTVNHDKRNYSITPAGIEVLQADWKYYSRELYGS